MGKVFACFSIALHNFKKWAVNPRLYILLLIEILYLHSRLSPVGALCVRRDIRSHRICCRFCWMRAAQ